MIHYTAYIDRDARVARDTVKIGANSRVCQFSSVLGNTVLGDNCLVWPNVMLDGPRFGDRCKIGSGVAMGPGFSVGDDCFIGPNVVFANDMWPAVDRTGFDMDALRLGRLCIIVEDGVSIGANAVILPGVIIGAGAVIAAGARVGIDVSPGHVFFGDRASVPKPLDWRERRMKWVNP